MPTRADLVEQIVRLLDIRLLDPLEILLEGDDAVAALRGLVRVRAGGWADLMRAADDRIAAGAVIRLVATLYPGDRAFDPPVDWWRTPLGRVTALRVGHPSAESVSLATAGAMLGITRQGVHDLVRRGKLPRHPDGGVPSAAVRDRLRHASERANSTEANPSKNHANSAKANPSENHDNSANVNPAKNHDNNTNADPAKNLNNNTNADPTKNRDHGRNADPAKSRGHTTTPAIDRGTTPDPPNNAVSSTSGEHNDRGDHEAGDERQGDDK
ncbi:hypothetical protein AB0M36_00775 [Actinoplanes sp. NPDC051346]|uniref:hypothetical protein n=1 Tax=Actinoplanes sp. NPDC051346 TaxID=3155048 RepID=UPI003426C96E